MSKHLHASHDNPSPGRGGAPRPPLKLSREDLMEIVDIIIPIIENRLFGKPEFDPKAIAKMPPAKRTEILARMLAYGR